MKEVTFSLPKGETTLGELRMAGYVFFIGVNRDTPMLIYKSVYLDGKWEKVWPTEEKMMKRK